MRAIEKGFCNYLSGHIRSFGSVDKGTTQTDSLDVERERGISVRAAVTRQLMNELVVMRGEFDAPIVRQERMDIEGLLPVATTLDFPARLGSMTKGRGTLLTFLSE